MPPLQVPRARLGSSVAVLVGLLAATTVIADSATQLQVLREHARGRRLLVTDGVPAAQAAWDRALDDIGSPGAHAVVVGEPCGRKALQADLARLRDLSPLWIGGGANDCYLLAWGYHDGELAAESAARLLPIDVVGSAPQVVRLVAPLRELAGTAPAMARRSPESPPPASVADAEAEPDVVTTSQPEPEPPTPTLPPPVEDTTPPAEPDPEPEPATQPASEPESEPVPDPSPSATFPSEPDEPQEPEQVEPVAPAESDPAPEPVPEVVPDPEPGPEPVAPPEPEPETTPPPEPEPEVTVAPEPEVTAPPEPELSPDPEPVPDDMPAEEEPPLAQLSASEHFALGNESYESGDVQLAIRHFEASIELEPENPRSHNNLGTSWLLAGDAEAAEQAFRAALERDPEYTRALLNLSTALYAQQRTDEALETLGQVLEQEPANLDAIHNRAALLIETRRWEEAAASLEDGLAIAPDNQRLARMLEQVRSHVAAVGTEVVPADVPEERAEPPAPVARSTAPPPTLTRASRSGCRDTMSQSARVRVAGRHFRRGQAAYASGRHDDAEELFGWALDCDPTSPAIFNHLGAARLEQGSTALAEAAFRRAIELEPEFTEARVNLSFALFHQDRCDEAVSELRAVASDDSVELLFQLGRVLYRCGRSIEAADTLETASRVAPDDERVARLLDRIASDRIAVP